MQLHASNCSAHVSLQSSPVLLADALTLVSGIGSIVLISTLSLEGPNKEGKGVVTELMEPKRICTVSIFP